MTLAFAGLFGGPAAALRAAEPGDVGIVRISDSKLTATPDAISTPGAPIGDLTTAGGCANGNCGANGHGCGNGRGCGNGHSHACLFGQASGDGEIYPPDYGWGRPVKTPIERIPVIYHKYWPDYWTGECRDTSMVPRFPMVYMPTDTTQLGYYYQRVPQWQPNPAMIPPAPFPSQWHKRESDYFSGFCNHGRGGATGAGCETGDCGPAGATGPAIYSQPSATPVGPTPATDPIAPPPPVEPSARRPVHRAVY
jgi:hypothetical protein